MITLPVVASIVGMVPIMDHHGHGGLGHVHALTFGYAFEASATHSRSGHAEYRRARHG